MTKTTISQLVQPEPSVVNNFKAATPEGRTGFEVLKPIVTCLDIKLEDECKMKPSCIWYTLKTVASATVTLTAS